MSDNRVLTLKEDLIEIADAIRTKKNLKGDLTFSQLKANTLEAINTSEFKEFYTKDIATWDTLNVDNFEKTLTFPNTLLIHSNGIDVYYKENNGLYHYSIVTKVSTFLCSPPEGLSFRTSMESSNGTVYIQYSNSSPTYNSTFYKISGNTITKTYEGVILAAGSFYETKKGDVYAYYDSYSNSTYCYYRRIVHLGDEATLLGPFGDKFFETSEGDLYVGENKDTGALYYLKGNTLTKLCGGKGSNWLYYYETRNKDFYISGIKGFVHVAKDTVTILSNSNINAFFETSKGTLYVGCDGSGGAVGIDYVNGTELVSVRQNSSEGDYLKSFGWEFYEATNDNIYARNWDVDGLWFLSEGIATKVLSGIYNRESVTFYAGKDGYSYLTLNQNHPGLYVIDKANTTQLRTSGYWNTEVLNTEEGLFLLLSGTLLKVYQGEVTELQTSLGSTDEIFKLNNKTLFTVRTSANSVTTKHLYYLANSQLKTVVSAKWYNDYRNWSINLFESSDGTLYVSSTFANSSSFGWRGIYTIQSNLTITKVYNGDTNYLFYETSNGFVYASPFPRTNCVVNGGIVKLSPTAGKQIYAEGLGWIPRAEKDTKILFTTSTYPDTKDDIAVVVEGDTVHRLLLTKSIGGYIEPEGTLDITENGEYDVTDKASVNVNVASSGGASSEPVTWETLDIDTAPLLDVAYSKYTTSSGETYISSNDNSNPGIWYAAKNSKTITKIFDKGAWWDFPFEDSKGNLYLSPNNNGGNHGIIKLKNGIATNIWTSASCFCSWFEDSKGLIYVSSMNGNYYGILKIYEDTVSPIYTKGQTWEYIYEDDNENIYMSGYSQGLLHIYKDKVTLLYDESTAKRFGFPFGLGDTVYASCNNVQGIFMLTNGTATHLYTEGYSWGNFMPTSNGTIYVSSASSNTASAGILKITGNVVEKIYPTGYNYSSLIELPSGEHYILPDLKQGGASGILYLYNDNVTLIKEGRPWEYLITSSAIYLYASNGYSNKGLWKVQGSTCTCITNTENYYNYRVFKSSKDQIFISCNTSLFYGLYYIENDSMVKLITSNEAWNLYESKQGVIYASASSNRSTSGILKFDESNSTFITLNKEPKFMFEYVLELENGDIYTCSKTTSRGVFLIQGDIVTKLAAQGYYDATLKKGEGLLFYKKDTLPDTATACYVENGKGYTVIAL
jgi:hypothetical protein